MSRITQRLAASLFAFVLTACAHQASVTPPMGEDFWSRRVRETWAPQTQKSIRQFEELSRSAGWPEIKTPPRFIITTRDEPSRPKDATNRPLAEVRIPFSGKDNPRSLQIKSVSLPVAALTIALADQLANGKADQAPLWMVTGSSYVFADTLMARMGLSESAGLLRSGRDSLIRGEAQDSAEKIQALANSSSGELKGLHAAGWLVLQLKEIAGDRFMPGWQVYYTQAGRAGFAHAQAFEQAFGISESAFMQQLESRLLALRAEKRNHAGAIPAASGYALATETVKLPFETDLARNGYARYLKAPAPKAFAFSPRDVWAYVDDSAEAMLLALDLCRQHDPISCQLYAVDDQVVFTPSPAATGRVEVRTASADSFAQSWLPITQTRAEAFTTQIHTLTGAGLEHSVRVHVASNRDDFERVLLEDMGMLRNESRHHREHSGGLSNARGQIAILLPQSTSDSPGNSMQERITGIVLHELAHEWQGQLSRQYAGFIPPEWIIEGSAELLAVRIASSLDPDVPHRVTPEKRLRYLEDLFRLGATPPVKDVFAASSKEWRTLSARGAQHYALAELMVNFLARETGPRFNTVLAAYFRLAASRHHTHHSAFSRSFDMTPDEFLGRFEVWLKTP